jgi:hypothetical protein
MTSPALDIDSYWADIRVPPKPVKLDPKPSVTEMIMDEISRINRETPPGYRAQLTPDPDESSKMRVIYIPIVPRDILKELYGGAPTLGLVHRKGY